MKYFLLILLLFIYNDLVAQNYYSIIEPQEFPLALTEISNLGEDILISARVAILQQDGSFTLGSKMLWFNEDLDLYKTAVLSNYAFSWNSVKFVDDSYYGFCDKWLEESVSFVQLDESGVILNTVDIPLEVQSGGVSTVSIINNFLYGSAFRQVSTNQKTVTIYKFSFSGELIWSHLVMGDNFYELFELLPSLDNELLAATNFFENFKVYNEIIKFDVDGNVKWRFVDEAEGMTGSSVPWLATLSNGNILMKSIEYYGGDPIFNLNDWSTTPNKLTWVSNEGDFIRDTLLTAPRPTEQVIVDVTVGKGDYFFAFGRWEEPITGNYFGWVFKMSNDGVMIWDKKFKHFEPSLDVERATIDEVLELDNGDLIFAGTLQNVSQGTSDLWITKVNENGCFGELDCSDNLITSISNPISSSDNLIIYPNPANSLLHIDVDNVVADSNVEILSIEGKVVLRSPLNELRSSFDISNLPVGLFFVRLNDGILNIETKKLIIQY